jgi:hypothetical protein
VNVAKEKVAEGLRSGVENSSQRIRKKQAVVHTGKNFNGELLSCWETWRSNNVGAEAEERKIKCALVPNGH